jgi:hypothetical protein
VISEYAGAGGDGVYDLSAVSRAEGPPACAPPPQRLRLRCREESVDVLAPGAVLVRGKKGPDDRIEPPSWSPASRERVGSLVCEIATEEDAGLRLVGTLHGDGRLAFAPAGRAPGIEWADENSDMSAQTGAYRWMVGIAADASPHSTADASSDLSDAMRRASADAGPSIDAWSDGLERNRSASLPTINVQSCKMAGGPTGAGHLTVTFARSGEAISVVVDFPPFKGTAVGECVAATYRALRVRPFAGENVRVGKSFTIN